MAAIVPRCHVPLSGVERVYFGQGGPRSARCRDDVGVAVDAAGNVYVTDSGASRSRVLKLPAGSTKQIELPFTGLNQPHGVAVDHQGDVYLADYNNRQALELAAGSTSQAELPCKGLSAPAGLAVDSGGNVYVADSMRARVVKLANG